MVTSLVKADYSGQEISFTEEGWFNATAASARYGKFPNDWMRLPETQDYINALSRKYGKISYYKTKRGQGGGTWLHPKLAIRFAQWLDIDFAVWCDEQIDSLLRSKHPHFDHKKLRHAASASFKVMTDILQYARAEAGKATEAHHYSNEALLINWALSGERKKLDRDSMSSGELSLLAKLEERNSVLIAREVPYQDRKKMLEQFALDLRAEQTIQLEVSP